VLVYKGDGERRVMRHVETSGERGTAGDDQSDIDEGESEKRGASVTLKRHEGFLLEDHCC
jgi:hypothetical protein